MTTTDKRGFRLPWGSENRKPEDDSEPVPVGTEPRRADPGAPATDLAPAIAATTNGTSARAGSSLRRNLGDDLGRGPFDLEPDPEPEAPPAATVEAPAAEPTDGLVAWPDIDRAGSAKHLASDAPPPPRPAVVVQGDAPATPRKTNPLMAGLVKAMRDAARSARDEATAKMKSDAAARLAEIRTQGATAGLTLRKAADEDIAAIREWSKAEAARIRTETDERIAKRRAELLHEVEDHAAETQRLQAQVNGAISAFDAEMDRFFDILLKEEDPARLATLAERLPEAPSFARPMGPAGAPAPRPRAARSATAKPRQRRPSERLAPDAAAAAEAAAIEGLDEVATDVMTEPEPAAFVEPEAGVEPEQVEAQQRAAVADVETLAPTDPELMAEPVAQAAPVAEAAPEVVDVPEAPVEADPVPEPDAPAGSLASVLATAPRIDSPDDLSPEERIALLGFDEPEPDADAANHPSPTPVLGVRLEPESDTRSAGARAAEAPIEDVTRIVVSGLTSVAGISAFKSALGAVTGVMSVSVTSGMDHDFVFSVVHADATDLRRAIAAFPAFAAQMTLDEGSVVTFIVTEPAT